MLKKFFSWILGMGTTSWDRVIVAITALAGVTVLGYFKIIDPNSIVGLYYTVVGFMLGHQAGSKSQQLKEEAKIQKYKEDKYNEKNL